jgi:peptide/nickel transport system permease protein
MIRFLATRLGASVLTGVLITLLIFLLLHLAPGDPADQLVPPDASHAEREQARRQWSRSSSGRAVPHLPR